MRRKFLSSSPRLYVNAAIPEPRDFDLLPLFMEFLECLCQSHTSIFHRVVYRLFGYVPAAPNWRVSDKPS